MAEPTLDFDTIPITEKEVKSILIEAGMAEQAKDTVFVAALTINIVTAQTEAVAAIYEEMVKSLTGPTTSEILEAAKQQAVRESKRITGSLAKTELDKIAEVVRRGLEEGRNPLSFMKDLEAVKGLDAPRAKSYWKFVNELEDMEPALSAKEIERRSEREFKRLLKKRKETIARTEGAFAQADGRDIQAKARGKEYKAWITAGDGDVSDECETNEEKGWIEIDKSFPHASLPPQHPNCRCNIVYRTQKPGKTADERVKQRAAKTKAAKEAAKTEAVKEAA